MSARANALGMILLLSTFLSPVTLALAGAADDPGITVSGVGEVSRKPDTVEFRARVAGAAELSGDARVKYLDAKRRTLATLQELKLKNLKVDVGGVSVAASQENAEEAPVLRHPGTGPAVAVNRQVEFSSTIRVTLNDIQDTPEEKLIETVSKLLDKLHDAGVTVIQPAQDGWAIEMDESDSYGSSAAVATFVLENSSDLREQAYQQAFAAARSSAERLAKLAGVKLGPVAAMQETEWPGSQPASPQGLTAGVAGERDKPRLGSNKFAPIPVRVGLQVRFGIQRQ